jgi:beta-phosphoglucomutase
MASLGLSRASDEELLAAAEPDVLVTSLDDVDLDALAEGRLAQRGASPI